MKKIAIISEVCYAHIDCELIPLLSNFYRISWFPFFYKSNTNATVSKFVNISETLSLEKFSFIQLSSRMRSFTTKKEFECFIFNIKKENPDVLYINSDGFPWLPIIIRKYFHDIPVIGAIHDVVSHSGSSLITKIYKPLLPLFYRYLNTYSEFCYLQLNKKKYRGKKIFCAHHPYTDFGKITKKEHEKFTILFFGNLLEYKGLPLLLRVGELIHNYNSNICIKIVGRGVDEYLLDPYRNHPAFRIINRRVEDYEIPEVFSDVDCLALPYSDASQSGPMMIALNYAIPVLATDIPAFKEYGQRFSLITLLQNDVDIWVEYISTLCNSFPNSFNENDILQYKTEIEKEKTIIQEEWKSLFFHVGGE